MKSLLSPISLVLLWVGLPTAVQAQDRTWTDIEGRKIPARAVAKDDKNVRLRLADGKRVSVPLTRLSQADLDWIKDWKAPDFAVKATMRDFKGNFGINAAREFEFRSGRKMRAVIFEDEIPAFIKAIHEFFELAKKVTPDVPEYEKALHKGKAHGSTGLWTLLVFEVHEGRARANGGKLRSEDGSKGMKPAELMQLLDFLEGFSVAEWEGEQERIKKQFE